MPESAIFPETNDLIYEGIATFIIVAIIASGIRRAETNDLIYEGIATPAPFGISVFGHQETNDLIYEGIATSGLSRAVPSFFPAKQTT